MKTRVNGDLTESLSVLDRGLAYGDGLFETVAVRSGQPLLWSAHIERLLLGCSRLKIPSPNVKQLRLEAEQLCQQDDGVLKIVVTRGVGRRGYAPVDCQPTRIISFTQQHRIEKQTLERICVRLCQHRLSINPQLAGIKHLNRLEQVLARAEWDDDRIAEGIICSAAGEVIEGVSSNLFVVQNGVLLTPDLSQCGVAGVMRAQVIQAVKKMDVKCQISQITLDDLHQADEVLLCNSLTGIRVVKQCEGVVWPQVGEISQQLWQKLRPYW
ncbi:MAG: aminodeoxychorismate lyase [Gammaproteobacteria bacterium]|nr:aminodeoxychorismate lyase [Gammaproteobacteria bacterium]